MKCCLLTGMRYCCDFVEMYATGLLFGAQNLNAVLQQKRRRCKPSWSSSLLLEPFFQQRYQLPLEHLLHLYSRNPIQRRPARLNDVKNASMIPAVK